MITFMTAVALTVGVGLAPQGGLMKLEVSHEQVPVYVWASVESSESRLRGQGLADLDFASVGLGTSRELVAGLSIFGEVGYTYVDTNVKPIITQEVVFTHLVDRHAVPSRPIPVPIPRPYRMDTYETSYDIDHSYVLRVGLKWAVSEHVLTSLSYRYFQPEETMDLWNQDNVDNGGGWWSERDQRSFSGAEFLVSWHF